MNLRVRSLDYRSP